MDASALATDIPLSLLPVVAWHQDFLIHSQVRTAVLCSQNPFCALVLPGLKQAW
jgi:hypothetical protein